MSTLKYLHKNEVIKVVKGVKNIMKQHVTDGTKGLSLHYLYKKGEDDFKSVTVRQGDNEQFSIVVKVEDKEPQETNVDMTGLMKFLKGDKDL